MVRAKFKMYDAKNLKAEQTAKKNGNNNRNKIKSKIESKITNFSQQKRYFSIVNNSELDVCD